MTESEGKMKIYKPQEGHNLTWAQQPTQKDETFYIGCLALFERVVLDNRYGGQVRLADRAMSTGLFGLGQAPSAPKGYHSSTSTNITVSMLPTSTATEKRSVSHVENLVTECGITAAELAKYNPDDSLCSSLAVGQPICCSGGSLPDLTPQPNDNGTCYSYTVQDGDYCALLAEEYYITTDEIEEYNAQTWGWMGCSNLQLDAVICLSSGEPPMPAVLPNAVCGPQVEGSTRPSDWSDISSLNPCPLNACCDIWGQCGITPEFCTVSESTTGAPGIAAEGEYGCISNCGTSITNNDAAPSEFLNVGYFEAFGVDRSCLVMNASQLPSSYSHVHFAFGQISSDFDVDLSGS
ncbi:uncharacterized protein ASPGLDRAFT_40729 [Aspergillus glaucus CBS 516.65]|uniref:LysM domain-containing protein n=1 Tax=Aspergillus glaucus CBS 516.65 TaxID=1160497 RepID=A0A1L9V3P3_ASPGL|nr:hypothetical protein ASPGLDRAFT_40729 [Aspergillus glaucus CBS 516.65]OJJ78536.1 hypothetical protein ASPGLDRAFT_40729 [Aspergillus glaucus CBS 516.65]